MFYLQNKSKEFGKISVGIVGTGLMGTSLFCKIVENDSFSASVLAGRNEKTLFKAVEIAGIKDDEYIFTNDIEEAKEALKNNLHVLTNDIYFAASITDVVVDCTGDTEVGTLLSLKAIEEKVNIVSLNVEMDATVGPYLKKLADDAGIVYSGSAGDEPGAILDIYEFAINCGFEVLVLGKGKNNKLDNYASPDDLEDDAKKKGVNSRMLTSFVDGTNTMFELNAVCNATGFVPDVSGCHFIDTNPKNIAEDFKLKSEGGILNSYKVVDFATGIAPGVFAVVRDKNNFITDEMKYLSMGEGPNFSIYRPYHLTSLETPQSIIRAVVLGDSTIAPVGGPVAETIAIAKRDIKKGESFDSIGGYMIFGRLVTSKVKRSGNHVPIGIITKGSVAKRDIKKGTALTYEDINLNEDSEIVRIRKLQDEFFY
ncbi:NAD(P)H-dependent oxidoreductase [Peptoniphilus sp.]|jgi:predicted homoserine dehydrogenase-like protein|uniref:NAD(P)H-dependent oxidoreductase n=1 Tax=Peptoniphilus sp. TaxID=1971214 RepID=UPI003D93C259